MNSEFRYRGYWIPFPKPVPAVVGTAWDGGNLRTICVSEDWLPYILGALGVLARRETYYGDPADIEFSVEQANHILSNWREECPMTIQFRQSLPCLLEYSLDGGTTWQGAYDGQECINANIADGTLAAGTSANPSSPAPVGGCTVYHIQVQEQTDFVLPTTVSAGDLISVDNVSGAWADGWLGNLWYCYDGSVYVLGVCISGSNPAKNGDPLQTAEHQQLICKVGDTYYNPLSGSITVPGGVSNALISFLPNNGTARSGGTGVVQARVTVCNNSNWCYHADFRSGSVAPFTIDQGTVDSSGLHTVVWNTHYTYARIYKNLAANATILKVRIKGTWTAGNYTGSDALRVMHNNDSAYILQKSNTQVGTGDFDITVDGLNVVASNNISITAVPDWEAPLVHNATITEVWFYGVGTNPFGSNNCSQ